MTSKLPKLILPFLLFMAGCNGDGSGFSDYSGVWDVRYNLVTDECQVVLPTVPGFVDQHYIDDQDGAINFDSASGFVANTQTTRSEDDSFVANQTVTGDLFGDGSSCTLTSSFEYSDPKGDSASSLFSQTISCNDGFSCTSQGVGESVKQP